MLNQCTFIGRLTRTPELRHTAGKNKPVTSFTLAVDRDRPEADGNFRTDFIDFVAYEGFAINICERYVKGDLLAVTGRLTPRLYTNSSKVTRLISEIIVEACYKLRTARNADSGGQPAKEPIEEVDCQEAISD